MNIDKLSNEEYFSAISEIDSYYRYKLPKDVRVALFVSIEKDKDRTLYKLERQITRGQEKLYKLLLQRNPELHKKLFRR